MRMPKRFTNSFTGIKLPKVNSVNFVFKLLYPVTPEMFSTYLYQHRKNESVRNLYFKMNHVIRRPLSRGQQSYLCKRSRSRGTQKSRLVMHQSSSG